VTTPDPDARAVPVDQATQAPVRAQQRRSAPALRVRTVVRGLDIPWDIAVLPGQRWLITERDRERILLRTKRGRTKVLARTPPGIWHSGETGLMSIAADPRFGRNHRFYTCHGARFGGGRHDIRVVAWKLRHGRSVRRVDTLVHGIQITSGRHGGCRIRFSPDGAMWVGTGDSAVGTNPQNRRSLNGKVLRLNRFTGRAWRTNPWRHAGNRHRRLLFTYGHRNVQGLAWRPGGGMWSVEHGTYRDDEVNRLVKGGNYGWNPVPGYDESKPMTDFSLPGRQIGARWRSGYPTIATSGATWVKGKRWGTYRGTLAVAALKGERVTFIRFTRSGRVRWVRTPGALHNDYGRLRSVVQTAGGALLVTTANGGGSDRVIKVTPRR